MRWKRRLYLFRWLLDETAPAVSASVVDDGKRCFYPSPWFSSTSTVLYLCFAPRIESGLDSVSRWLSTAATIALCGGSVRIKRHEEGSSNKGLQLQYRFRDELVMYLV
ncbi:hypothetical protein DY000_02058356 [Brassica cretica]|uniref:Secreted protein n=1 Tax=Brassica cretica TaxID=69181 RepID=A0ABQ7AG68_BRACR|nr:hypothetical protein DY000_02058356 [Brassica cretica]